MHNRYKNSSSCHSVVAKLENNIIDLSAIPQEISIDDVPLHNFEDSLSAKKVSDHDHKPLIIWHKKVYWHSYFGLCYLINLIKGFSRTFTCLV